MALASLQVGMDSPDWLQGTILEDSEMNSSSSPSSGDMMMTCSRPLIERRLRPPQDQALKCPRCDSAHTKFCYYNNYSLSQPRYFCKTCRRYWTKGGTLRNIPVGGGCRKNRKVSSKKNHDLSLHNNQNNPPSSLNSTDLHLSFPDPVQLSHLNNNNNPNFMDMKYDFITENSRPVGFMDTKYDIMANSVGDMSTTHGFAANFHGSSTLYSPYGMSLEGNYTGNFLDSCQRLAFPYEGHVDHSSTDVKPNTKILSLEWQDQGCSDAGKESFGYLTNGFGSWTGFMNGYGSSATNPLI